EVLVTEGVESECIAAVTERSNRLSADAVVECIGRGARILVVLGVDSYEPSGPKRGRSQGDQAECLDAGADRWERSGWHGRASLMTVDCYGVLSCVSPCDSISVAGELRPR